MNAPTRARFIPLLLVLALLSACNLARIAAPSPTPNPTPQPIAPDGSTVGVIPSITPLAGSVTTQTVFITATPMAGFGAQTVYVTATPFGLPAGSGGVSIAVTPGNPTLAPAPTSTNVIDSLINNVAIPAWNFLYTLVLDGLGSLWNFAGARGGLFAQGLCCLLPAVLLTVLGIRSAISRRRWLL